METSQNNRKESSASPGVPDSKRPMTSTRKRSTSVIRETIHPRISRETKSAGTQLAYSRQEKPNTFWSTVICNGLPITAALTPPDEAGRHGPWSSKQLAQMNRLLVEQLLAFQIREGELPSVLEVLRILSVTRQFTAPPPPLTTSLSSENDAGKPISATLEMYEATIDSTTIQQDITDQGFGSLSLSDEE